jgi:hypothetical protein
MLLIEGSSKQEIVAVKHSWLLDLVVHFGNIKAKYVGVMLWMDSSE